MRIDFRQPTILFGGSFDPPHEGHLELAKSALKALPEIKQFAFVPAGESPKKRAALASKEQRLEWVKLLADQSAFQVWDFEVTRPGESFTVNTLEEAHRLGAQKSSLYWLLGADAYGTFPSWKNPERIRALCNLLIANRPGHSPSPQNPADRFISMPPSLASSTEIRAQLASGNNAPIGLPAEIKAALDKLLPGQNPYVRKNI